MIIPDSIRVPFFNAMNAELVLMVSNTRSYHAQRCTEMNKMVKYSFLRLHGEMKELTRALSDFVRHTRPTKGGNKRLHIDRVGVIDELIDVHFYLEMLKQTLEVTDDELLTAASRKLARPHNPERVVKLRRQISESCDHGFVSNTGRSSLDKRIGGNLSLSVSKTAEYLSDEFVEQLNNSSNLYSRKGLTLLNSILKHPSSETQKASSDDQPTMPGSTQ